MIQKKSYSVSDTVTQRETEIPNVETSSKPATYEEAITAAGFGKFNIIFIVFGLLPGYFIIANNCLTVSHITPILQCDFKMSAGESGVVNASGFLGGLFSSFLWGYLADTMGRKKLLIIVSLLDGVSNIIMALSPNMYMVIVFKFASGFMVVAIISLIITYLSEYHSIKHKNKVILCGSMFSEICNLIIPLLAWAILPYDFHFFRSWRVFVIICALPNFILCYTIAYIPETPKFLINSGRHDEALAVFKKIYTINNTNKSSTSYPITLLLCEPRVAPDKKNITVFSIMRNNTKQFKPLLHKPYSYRLLTCLSLHFCVTMGLATFKVWLPDMLTIIDKNKSKNIEMCEILLNSINKTKYNNNASCSALQYSNGVFTQLNLIGVGAIITYIIIFAFSSLTNMKMFLGILFGISGLCGIALKWISDLNIFFVISAIYTAELGIAISTLFSIIVDVFPTDFRASAILLSATAGRLGSSIGIIIFPILFYYECALPFIYIGVSISVAIIPLIFISLIEPETN